MAKAESSARQRSAQMHQPKGYAKRISDHIAMALVVYTLDMAVFPSRSIGCRGYSIFPWAGSPLDSARKKRTERWRIEYALCQRQSEIVDGRHRGALYPSCNLPNGVCGFLNN
jgi:hypothetical protein